MLLAHLKQIIQLNTYKIRMEVEVWCGVKKLLLTKCIKIIIIR